MPRKYLRKCPDRKVCTQEQINAAKKLMEEGKSKRTAAGIVGIDESTLRKRLKLDSTASSMGRYKPTFTREQEEEIYSYCKASDNMFYGLTLNSLRKIVYEFADVNKIENRFDKIKKMAGKDWVYEFMKRHPDLALRQTTPTSIARAIGFNEVQVKRFYTNLKECQEKYNFPPSRIYNMDETGISTVPKKTPKVISLKGKRNVNKIVSGERGQTITVVCCVSATGNYVPPAFIFPRKRMKGELLDGAPVGSIGMTSDSGFINTDLYLNWLEHFKHCASPTVDNPVLLIIDNHSSHISLQATLFCRQHNIVVLTLPPHSSHKIQPLDRAIYSPLKNQYSIEADRWMAQHPGRSINQYQITSIFDNAFKRVATVGNAASAFRVTGIYPFDDNLFTEADFAPSSVTDMFSRPSQVVSQNLSGSNSANFVEIQEIECHQTVTAVDEEPISIHCESADLIETHEIEGHNTVTAPEALIPFESGFINSAETQETASHHHHIVTIAEVHHQKIPLSFVRNERETVAGINKENEIALDIEPLNSTIILSEPMEVEKVQQGSSPSILSDMLNVVSHIPLTVISPLPKATHVQTRRKTASKSQIITDSPFKNKLEEKEREKVEKASKVRKPKMNSLTETKNKPNKKKNEKANTRDNKKKDRKQPSNRSKKDFYCPLCQEKYEDPPTEEWIQCNICKTWWHEDCTSYENGVFTCDLCLLG